MAELKTKATTQSVSEFLNAIDDKKKRADCRSVAKMMREATGKRARMWGASIVGFGVACELASKELAERVPRYRALRAEVAPDLWMNYFEMMVQN